MVLSTFCLEVAVANGVKLCGATPIYADNAPGMLTKHYAKIVKIASTSTIASKSSMFGSQW